MVTTRQFNLTEKRFKGLKTPVFKDSCGYFSTVGTTEVIRSSIRNILFTKTGERVMLPEFGCRLRELVFEPNDNVLLTLARLYITEAINQWEPRVELTSINLSVNEEKLFISLAYVINLDGVEDNLELFFRRER
jgi:phage baseplate assembly protein W